MDTFVVGEFKQFDRHQMAKAAARADATAVFCSSVPGALSRMRSGENPPVCVLVSGDADVKRLVDGVRDNADLFSVPVLVLLSRPSSDAYRNAYLAGADDVVIAGDIGGFTRRLANLNTYATLARPAPLLGPAVVASRSEEGRRRLGRTLRQAGFDVSFASNAEEVQRMRQRGMKPAFAVIEDESHDGAASSDSTPCRVTTLDDIPALILKPHDDPWPASGDDPIPDLTGKLLFFADEQAKRRFAERRGSPRKPYSAICSFRTAGTMQPTYGVTHNVSREGLYIRTLDAPRPETAIWLEFDAPVTGVPVHLKAHAVWRRHPGDGKGVLPPGFGLRIDPLACPPKDLLAFLEGYEALT